MKTILFVTATVISMSAAMAKTVRGQENTPSTFTPFVCDSQTIPQAVGRSIDAALAGVFVVCTKPRVSTVRVLNLGPHGCGSWNPGYAPLVEIDFDCAL